GAKRRRRRGGGRTTGGWGGGRGATNPGSGRLVTITASTGSGSGAGAAAAASSGASWTSTSGGASTALGFRARVLGLARVVVVFDCAPVLRERAEVVTRRDIARAVCEFSLTAGPRASG